MDTASETRPSPSATPTLWTEKPPIRVKGDAACCATVPAPTLVQFGGGADVEPGQLRMPEFLSRLLVEGTSDISTVPTAKPYDNRSGGESSHSRSDPAESARNWTRSPTASETGELANVTLCAAAFDPITCRSVPFGSRK